MTLENKITVQLTVNATFALNGENSGELMAHLLEVVKKALNERHLTGETLAEVEGLSARATLLPTQLTCGEKQHVKMTKDLDYGPECVIQAHTGFLLKTPAHPDECDYVRVCDPHHQEIAFWSEDEWAQSPQEVMGAIVGALCRGQSALGFYEPGRCAA